MLNLIGSSGATTLTMIAARALLTGILKSMAAIQLR